TPKWMGETVLIRNLAPAPEAVITQDQSEFEDQKRLEKLIVHIKTNKFHLNYQMTQ
ncbi:hypothetical protein J6590_107542, partial [Homalodisca vitripennis]